jgi:hypothetical protein
MWPLLGSLPFRASDERLMSVCVDGIARPRLSEVCPPTDDARQRLSSPRPSVGFREGFVEESAEGIPRLPTSASQKEFSNDGASYWIRLQPTIVATADQFAALEGVTTAKLTGREAVWLDGHKAPIIGPEIPAAWGGSEEERQHAEKLDAWTRQVRRALWGDAE